VYSTLKFGKGVSFSKAQELPL